MHELIIQEATGEKGAKVELMRRLNRRREPGKRRMSAKAPTPASRSSATRSSKLRVECPAL